MSGQLFAADVLWIWGVVVVHLVITAWIVDRGDPLGAAISVVLFLGGLAAVSGVVPTTFTETGNSRPLFYQQNVATYFQQHGWHMVGLIAGYAFLGLGWGAARWWLLLHGVRSKYERLKAEWLSPRNLLVHATSLGERAECTDDEVRRGELLRWAEACRNTAYSGAKELTNALKPVWKDHCASHGKLNSVSVGQGILKPDVNRYKAHFSAWIVFWPWSVVWTFFAHNPIAYVARLLAEEFKAIMEDITYEQFRDIDKELAVSPTCVATVVSTPAATSLVPQNGRTQRTNGRNGNGQAAKRLYPVPSV